MTIFLRAVQNFSFNSQKLNKYTDIQLWRDKNVPIKYQSSNFPCRFSAVSVSLWLHTVLQLTDASPYSSFLVIRHVLQLDARVRMSICFLVLCLPCHVIPSLHWYKLLAHLETGNIKCHILSGLHREFWECLFVLASEGMLYLCQVWTTCTLHR